MLKMWCFQIENTSFPHNCFDQKHNQLAPQKSPQYFDGSCYLVNTHQYSVSIQPTSTPT